MTGNLYHSHRMEISSGGCLSATSEEAPSSICESQTRSSTWWRRRWCQRAEGGEVPSRTNSRAKEEEEEPAEVSGCHNMNISIVVYGYLQILSANIKALHSWLLRSAKAFAQNNFYILIVKCKPHNSKCGDFCVWTLVDENICYD